MTSTTKPKKPLSLELLTAKVLKLEFESITPPSDEPTQIETRIQLAYNYKPEDKLIFAFIGIAISGEEAPFQVNLEYEGEFEINRKATKKEVEPIAKVNCNAILFPYVREIIADITRRGGYVPLHLASMNFSAMMEESRSTKSPRKKVGSRRLVIRNGGN